MPVCRCLFLIIGRVCISLIFVLAGLNKIYHWEMMKTVYATLLGAWDAVSDLSVAMQSAIEFLMDNDSIFLGIAAALEIIGGLMVLLGLKPKIGALLLVIFLVPITLLAHPFWIMKDMDKQIQYLMFMKNLAILGGLLILITSCPPKKLTENV